MKGFVALCLLLASSLAHAGTCTGTFPDGTRPVCSVTFDLWQTCTAADTVKGWAIAGPAGMYPAGQWQIRPWLDAPINIVRAELVGLYNDGHLWIMLGNNAQGDPMLWLAPGEYHGTADAPAGTSWAFPASSAAKDADYIDLHGSCGVGKYAMYRLTFYYTVSP